MNTIWKQAIITCPIHGKRVTKIPIYKQNQTFNNNYYESKYYTSETEPSFRKNDSGFYGKNNISGRHNSNNTSVRRQAFNNSYCGNNNISLSKAYKSSINNPIKLYRNKNENCYYKNIVDTTSNNQVKIKNANNSNISNVGLSERYIKEKKLFTKYNSYSIYNSNNNNSNNNTNTNKGSTSSYRRRNEKNQNNLEHKKMTPDRIYNRDRKNNLSYDLKNVNIFENKYNNKTFSNEAISNVVIPRKEIKKENNAIREYSSKTNDFTKKRLLTIAPQQNMEKESNSIIVSSTNLTNYKFYVSNDDYYTKRNHYLYKMSAQPTLSLRRNNNIINNNSNTKIFKTEYYDDYNYNDNYYYTEDGYKIRMQNKNYETDYDYLNNNGGFIKYDNSSPLFYYNDNVNEKINTMPNKINSSNNINVPYNYKIKNKTINDKKKKKILKFKLHDLKKLRENEFQIEKTKTNKDDENVEEYVEKYFDKDGKCIGGKKVIIKQEYDKGQKIIKKFVEEKYKSNSNYKILKKQGENSYINPIKNQEKKESIISSTIKSSNNNTLEVNIEEENNNNVNTIVTFGKTSKNSKLEEELENISEEKVADEQKIDIDSEFDEEELDFADEEKKYGNINNEEKAIILNFKKDNNEKINDNKEIDNFTEEININRDLEEINKENGGINKIEENLSNKKEIEYQSGQKLDIEMQENEMEDNDEKEK